MSVTTSLPTVPFGKTGMNITRVGFGSWAIGGGDWAVGWGDQEDKDSIQAIQHAVRRGVNWIDTAAIYGLGRSEEVVAAAMRDIPKSERPFIFTKCGLIGDKANPNELPKRVGAPAGRHERAARPATAHRDVAGLGEARDRLSHGGPAHVQHGRQLPLGGQALPGEVAFKLYDTYGLPMDFILDAARDLGVRFDEAGFEKAMQEQRTKARASWKGTHKEAAYPAVQYIPRKDVDQTQLQRTSHHTYCPYKGECAYYSIPSGGERSVNAVWTYEAPYASVSTIQEYLAFYPDRVDAIDVGVED